MALSSKSPNAIFMEIRKLFLSARSSAPADTRGSRAVSFPIPLCLSLLPVARKGEDSRHRERREIRFASNRAKADQRSRLSLLAQRKLSANLSRDDSSPRLALSGERKLSIQRIRNNCSRNTRIALLATKIKS